MPNQPIIRKTVVIDASGKILGRLATQIARLLQGKHKASYAPNVDAGDIVRVLNVSKIKTTGRKEEQMVYHHFSGYPGGLKTRKISEYRATDPARILRTAVDRMLPKNTFRTRRIKRLELVK